MKTDGHLGRCYLKGRAGDAANAVLTAVGYNLRLILAWLRATSMLEFAINARVRNRSDRWVRPRIRYSLMTRLHTLNGNNKGA
jgi:hypothetical protein